MNVVYLCEKRLKELGFCGLLLFRALVKPAPLLQQRWARKYYPQRVAQKARAPPPIVSFGPSGSPRRFRSSIIYPQEARGSVAFCIALDPSLTFLSNALMVAVPLPADPVPL